MKFARSFVVTFLIFFDLAETLFEACSVSFLSESFGLASEAEAPSVCGYYA